MDYKELMKKSLEERIATETNGSKKEKLIKLLRVLEKESLYKAAIYDYVYLVPADFTHYAMYQIPEIHQAFIDVVKNPSLADINLSQYITIVDIFTKAIPVEILKQDKELMEIIPNITFEQARQLFGGAETVKLLEDKNIYDQLIERAKIDNRIYGLMQYNEYSLNDGTAKLICKHDQGGRKIMNQPPEIQLQLIPLIEAGTKLDMFLRNTQAYDPAVQKAILESQILTEQLIVLQSENKSQDSFIPVEYEADIVAKHLNFIKELSYEQKLNFIFKMRNPEMQKYLMKSLNFAKNLVSHTDSYSFFIGIKDDDFLVETLCDIEILKSIGRFHFQYIIPKLSLEVQNKIYNHPVFQEYIRKHVYYADIIRIISQFDETIIDDFLPLLKKVDTLDYLSLFRDTKNKKYIPIIIDQLNTLKETNFEKYDEYMKYIASTLLGQEFVGLLTEEQFNYFNENTNKVSTTEEALSHLDRIMIPTPMQDNDKDILEKMNKDNPSTPEEINALKAYRLNKRHDDTISASIAVVSQTDERTIKKIGYEIINRVSPEDRKILLDRMTIVGLITHLPSSKHFIDYLYELYKTNPNIFDNLKFTSEDRVIHSNENLDEESNKKLIELFFLVPKHVQEAMLNNNFAQNESIKAYVKEKAAQDPNYYEGQVYGKVVNIFEPEELKKLLEALSVQNIMSFYSIHFFNDSLFDEDRNERIRDEVLLKRRDEIVHEINLNNNNTFIMMSIGTIISYLYNASPNKEEFLSSLNPTLLLDTYTQHPFTEHDTHKNQLIINILKNSPNVLINAKEDRVKRVLTTLSKKDLNNLLENFTPSHLVALLSKTKNKDTEEMLMTKFNENPYFINQTEQSLEEILSRLEEENKSTIYQTIDEQFKTLELPYNIKDKLRKLSYDEKIFLIYGVKENIFNEEKYQLILDLLNKDPFALNSMSLELFYDDIITISKKIIPKIYRYENLSLNYIRLIKTNNNRTRILLRLIEHLNTCTTNETVYVQKLEAIIGYLTDRMDLTLDRYNINTANENELHELEEYILRDSLDYLVETSNVHGYFTFANRENKGNYKTATEIETDRIIELDTNMDTEENIDNARELLFKKYFKINTKQAKLVLQKYITSIEEISSYIENPEVLKLLSDINIILNIKTIDELKSIYYSNPTKYNVEDFLYMFEELNKAYNKSIASNIKGYKSGKEKPLALVVDDETVIVNAIELETDFDLFVHSTFAYNNMDMINNNYFDSWTYSDKTSNHGICTSYISNSNLGTAKVKDYGVMFGFVTLNQNSITSIAPYDLVSRNESIVTTTNRPPMFTSLKELANYTRHTHNEAVLERRNVKEDSEYPVIQPDCIIIFEEMPDEIKANSIRAQKDFKEHGIDLPIIYINKRKVIELEARKLAEMISIFEKNPNLELLAEIINKYESNRCGLDFEENLDVEELFQKNKINELIRATLRQVKEVANKEDIIKFINIIELEEHKFKIIEETVGDRAHSFDLLDEEITHELNLLKQKYLQDTSAFGSKITK